MPHAYAHEVPGALTFFIKRNWDVFSSMGTLDLWWKLGNLRREPIERVFRRYERNDCIGLQTVYGLSAKRLVAEYCRPRSKRICSGPNDLLALYLARYCEDRFAAASGTDQTGAAPRS